MHTFNILLGQQQLKSWLDHGWITNFTLRCWTIKRPATGHKQNPYTLRQWLPDMPTTMPVSHFATIMVSKFCYGDNHLPIAPGHTWTHLNPFETTCHQLDAELDPDLQLRLSPTLWSGCLDWSPGPNCGITTDKVVNHLTMHVLFHDLLMDILLLNLRLIYSTSLKLPSFQLP